MSRLVSAFVFHTSVRATVDNRQRHHKTSDTHTHTLSLPLLLLLVSPSNTLRFLVFMFKLFLLLKKERKEKKGMALSSFARAAGHQDWKGVVRKREKSFRAKNLLALTLRLIIKYRLLLVLMFYGESQSISETVKA